jgi:uncharacterized protein YjbI with pentapeptide repeats
MKNDLSVNYYKNFSYTFSNIDVSANYGQNIGISDALNLKLFNDGIKIVSSYDASILSFEGSLQGYDFIISNVFLTIIDTSENSSSPFANGSNAQTYDMLEDASAEVPAAKYPNTAMQGLALKGIYPAGYNDSDYWIYLNHVSDYMTFCDPISVFYDSDVSANLSIVYDSSVFIGNKPVSINASCGIYDVSVGSVYLVDGSLLLDSSIIFNTTLTDYNLIDCSINNSIIINSYISGFLISDSSLIGISLDTNSVINSLIEDSSILNSIISDSSIYNSNSQGGVWTDVSIFSSKIFDTDLASSYISETLLQGDVSFYGTLSSSFIKDSSVKNYIINNCIINQSYLFDSSIVGGDSSLNIYDNTAIWNSIISFSTLLCSEIEDSSLNESGISNTSFENSSILDSSIYNGSIINNDSSIANSLLMNSWVNIFKLLISPSIGYEYTTDSSFSNVVISNTDIWDSSINKAIIYDSSIYNSWIQDSSLIGCTTYNCLFDDLTTSVNTRDILIDPSIGCQFDIIQDTSIFYLKHRKKIEVGMSGCSVGEEISAGDYLNWITVNGFWKKVGEVYIWISASDADDCTTRNLIDGFYVFNPHEFSVKIEYLVIV